MVTSTYFSGGREQRETPLYNNRMEEKEKVDLLSNLDRAIERYRSLLERLADEEDESGNPPENGKSSQSSSSRTSSDSPS